MKFSAIIVLLLLSTSIVFGQADFRSGYIINKQNDTIPGFINYSGNKLEECIFKSGSVSESTTYSPESIEAFGFENDKYFESKMVKSIDSTQRVFIEVLVKGEVSLYHYKYRFFVEKDRGVFYELKSEKQIVNIEGNRSYQEVGRYIGILKYLLQECDLLSQKIERIKINQENLTKLIETYNSCISADYVSYKDSKPWTKVSYGIAGGYDFYKLNLKVFFIRPAEEMSANNLQGDNFAIGGFVNIAFPRLTEKFFFRPELWYIAPEYYMYFEEMRASFIQRNDVSVSFSAIKIPATLLYTFTSGKFKPYINAGVSNYLIFNGKSKRIVETENTSNNVLITREDTPMKLSKYQFGMYGSVGLYYDLSKLHALFLETRLEKENGLANHQYYDSDVLSLKATTLSVIFGINF